MKAILPKFFIFVVIEAKFMGLSPLRQMGLFIRKKLQYASLLLLAAFFLQADQTPGGQLDRICPLPRALNESSGLVVVNENCFWSINDSGNEPVLYAFDSSGRLLRERSLTNATNTDWESLTHKGDTLFIGDFGNNMNARTNLAFWQVPPGQQKATHLPFQYPDQANFPPAKSNWNFDAEGSFYWKGHLYWFSKTRVTHDPHTKLYRMAPEPNAKAQLLDSFPIDNMITGADISPNGHQVVLMGYGNAYRLKPFKPHSLDEVEVTSISIPHSQTEAVAFLDSNWCYLTDEQGNLYRLPMRLFDDS
jgi:hypothetical protein